MITFKLGVKLAFGGQMPGLAVLATFGPTDTHDLPGFFFGVGAFVAHG